MAHSSAYCGSLSWPWPLLQSHAVATRMTFLGRRQLFLDGVSSSSTSSDYGDDAGPSPAQRGYGIPRSVDRGNSKEYPSNDTAGAVFEFTSVAIVSSFKVHFRILGPAVCCWQRALALGDPSVTLEEVTPPVFPSGSLFPAEERIAQLFEKNTYSVVNIFDVTLRPQLNVTGVVEIPEGNGSGVVWDEQGHIVTNYHVIGNALSRDAKPGQIVARVNILAADGVQKNFEGQLVGADRLKDLAVLKVEASKDLLQPIIVGQSNYLKVGQQCLAIGNPFGFDHTLTVGVISGLNRDIFSQTGVTIGGGIQTDAAINPGNSGGPLLDSKGKLIGINTAIFTQTGTSAGVGFAIPSTTVIKIVPQLIQFGKVVRAGINVEIAPDPVAYQLNVRNGALVLQVPGNSLAAKAGLVPTTRGFAGNIILGDVVVAVDGKPVRGKAELDKVLDEYNVGDVVKLRIRRGGENLELPITLEKTS